MPLFEYECKSCGSRFEELVNSSDGEVRCPECNSPETGKLLSVFSAATTTTGSSSAPSCYRPGCGGPGFT